MSHVLAATKAPDTAMTTSCTGRGFQTAMPAEYTCCGIRCTFKATF